MPFYQAGLYIFGNRNIVNIVHILFSFPPEVSMNHVVEVSVTFPGNVVWHGYAVPLIADGKCHAVSLLKYAGVFSKEWAEAIVEFFCKRGWQAIMVPVSLTQAA